MSLWVACLNFFSLAAKAPWTGIPVPRDAPHSALRGTGLLEESKSALPATVLSPVNTLQPQSGSHTKIELVFNALWGTKPEQRPTQLYQHTLTSLRKMEDLIDSVQFY